MVRLSYKQNVLNAFRDHMQSQVIRDRLLLLWKDCGFLKSSYENSTTLQDTESDACPDYFEYHLDTFASPETLRFQEYEFFQMIFQIIPTVRYLAPRNPLPKSSDFSTRLIFELPEDRFMRYFRMKRPAFFNLVNEIQDDEILQSESHNRQSCAALQLSVTLYRLGHSHQTLGEIACLFGIGEGTVQLFFDRIMVAILHLRSRYIWWPPVSTEAHHEMRKGVEAQSFFPGCVGYLDGSTIGLKYKPKIETATYWSGRKKLYGISLQAICDSSHKFRYIQVGYPGSVSDASAFAATDFYSFPRNYMESQEYVLADKGYTCTLHCITPYKRPLARQIEGGFKNFNKCHASARINIEHGFGILKARFPSLDFIPLYFSSLDDHCHFVKWILVTIILHNFLQNNENSDEYWLEDMQEVPEVSIEANENIQNENLPMEIDTRDGEALRNDLRQLFCN